MPLRRSRAKRVPHCSRSSRREAGFATCSFAWTRQTSSSRVRGLPPFQARIASPQSPVLSYLARKWRAAQSGPKPDPLRHREWLAFVLGEVLRLPRDCLIQDQALPPELRLIKTEEGETLRPDLVLIDPPATDLFGGLGTAPRVTGEIRTDRGKFRAYGQQQSS